MARNLGITYTDEKPYYFISYNTEDEKRVMEYAMALEKFCVPMWYDSGLKLGKEWEEEIAVKIENCQAVIMFLSKNIFSKQNSYVHKEFELATEYSMKNVYVIMLDKVAKPDVPFRFRSWWTDVNKMQVINAFEFDSPELCIQKLIENAEIESRETETDIWLLRKTTKEMLLLKEGIFYLGKDKELCRYYIDGNVNISRIHAGIEKKEGRVYFIDLLATNRSYINGDIIEPKSRVLLKNGDLIQMADEEFVVCYDM